MPRVTFIPTPYLHLKFLPYSLCVDFCQSFKVDASLANTGSIIKGIVLHKTIF